MSVRVSVQASDELTATLRHARHAPAAALAARIAASRNAVAATCTIVGVTNAEISITWLTDNEIADLNHEYLDHEGPTDVISFELYDKLVEDPVGDIYIGYEQATRQAVTFTTSLDDELVRLAVHGTLHVLGFDHPDGNARVDSVMWALQEAIVAEVLSATRGRTS